MSASSHRTTLPPATLGDMYLAAIVDELRALNRAVGELRTALQPPAEATDTVDLREPGPAESSIETPPSPKRRTHRS